MKTETPPAYEEGSHHSTGTQRESPASGSTIHRRPIAPQTTGTVPQDTQHDQSTNGRHVEKLVTARDPSALGGSIYSDPDTNGGVATPSAQSHYDPLPLEEVRCSLLPHLSATWAVRGTDVRLSALAAAVLLNDGILKTNDLDLFNTRRQSSDSDSLEPTDPISGVLSAAHGTVGGVLMGVADYPIEISRMLKRNRPLAKGMAAEFALDKGKGVSRIVGTGLRAPMDVTMGLSKGFHNLPKAYGDETVRRQDKVTGIQSGLRVAGKGFGYGLYDGISGIFVQPWKGAQKGGVLGGIKGFGKGIGGVVCKPAAGAIGLPAYAFKGVYEEVHKKRGFNMEKHMEAALITQGQEEWEVSSPEERDEVVRRWYANQTPRYEYLDGKYQ